MCILTLSSPFSLQALLPELLEMVLVKAVVGLNDARLLPQTDALAFITISTVCCEWWQVVTTRRKQIRCIMKTKVG